MKLPLHFVVSYVQPVTQHFNQELVESISGQSESLFGFSFTSPILPHRCKGKSSLCLGDIILWAMPTPSFVVPTIQLLSYCMISPTLPFTHSLAITLLTMMLPNKLCFLCTCHRLAIQYTLIIVVGIWWNTTSNCCT